MGVEQLRRVSSTMAEEQAGQTTDNTGMAPSDTSFNRSAHCQGPGRPRDPDRVSVIHKLRSILFLTTSNPALARRLVHLTMSVELVSPDGSESRAMMRVRPPSRECIIPRQNMTDIRSSGKCAALLSRIGATAVLCPAHVTWLQREDSTGFDSRKPQRALLHLPRYGT